MASFRGRKLRGAPTAAKGQMVAFNRPRQTNTDLQEERERQYHDAVSRDITSRRDVSGPTAVGQRGRAQKATGRRPRHSQKSPSAFEGTARAFLDHVISLVISPAQPPAPSSAVTSLQVAGDSGAGAAPPSPGRPKQSSLYLDAVRERARLTSAERYREEKAAVTIQSAWRGHNVRHSLKQQKSAEDFQIAEDHPKAKEGGRTKAQPASKREAVAKDGRLSKKASTKPVYPASKVKASRSRQSRGRRHSESNKYSYNMTSPRPQRTGRTAAAIRT